MKIYSFKIAWKQTTIARSANNLHSILLYLSCTKIKQFYFTISLIYQLVECTNDYNLVFIVSKFYICNLIMWWFQRNWKLMRINTHTHTRNINDETVIFKLNTRADNRMSLNRLTKLVNGSNLKTWNTFDESNCSQSHRVIILRNAFTARSVATLLLLLDGYGVWFVFFFFFPLIVRLLIM